jgi:phytoene dehydrogenase-like protein
MRRNLVADSKVVIVGGGIAGLVCARTLHRQGVPFHLLEAADDVGGRVRTDHVNGFQLDRGFQVLLESYPECKQQLDFKALDLQPFDSGALIRYRGRFIEFSDPWRKPSAAFKTLMAPNASLGDKIKLARLRKEVRRSKHRSASTTKQFLLERGLSSRVVDSFFRPFFGGVFLEQELSTCSGKFEYLFDKFGTGRAVIPQQGMGQIPHQLMDALPREFISLSAPVSSVSSRRVVLEGGEVLEADAVVVATDALAAAQLLGEPEPPKAHSVFCVYFAAPKRASRRPILILNGDTEGPINHLCWLSSAARGYAPAEQDLLSVTVLSQYGKSDESLSQRCRDQLKSWFGEETSDWEHLKTYEIKNALPVQDQSFKAGSLPLRHTSGIFRCGDYIEFASLNGAMETGRRCAEAVMESLKATNAA